MDYKGQKRIVSVSSGKGGVGKTTFAVNYALTLAQYGPTILVDLDTGTSSIRNVINAEVNKDLYHFFKRNNTMSECLSTLPGKWDPDGRYRNFAFVAGPQHFIDEIANLTYANKKRLIEAINGLNARFVVLDLKAGLDSNVIDFLPISNSGILVFTPHLPAATMAASDIVKAILFRKLRIIFHPKSPLYEFIGGGTQHARLINTLIDSVEDTYDTTVPNLDAFLVDLSHALGEQPLVEIIQNIVEYFHVYYVLNMFNGVSQSYEKAIQPFITNLVQNISQRVNIVNLGWIVESPEINRANSQRIPAVVHHRERRPLDKVGDELKRLHHLYLGLKTEKPRKAAIPHQYIQSSPDFVLDKQLTALHHMSEDLQGHNFRDNFEYIVHRSLYLMQGRRVQDFGDSRLFTPEEFVEMVYSKAAAKA